MEFTRLRASFGRLEQEELTLKPGLNIIEAPNESGKSTWAAFIRAMFYGIRAIGRTKGSMIPDRQRYQPWSGTPMAGELDMTWQGERLTLRRASPGGGRPMHDAIAVMTDTEERIEGLCGPLPGEKIIGVGETVYRRSAFISGTELGVDTDAQLERRIMNLVSSGEELSSYTEVDERLRRWQRQRRYRNNGELPAAEAALRESRDRLTKLEEKNCKVSGLLSRQEALEAKQRALEDELRRHNRDEHLARQRQAEENYRAACEQAEAAEAKRQELSEKTALFSPEGILHLRTADKALELAQEGAENAEKTRLDREKTLNALPAVESVKYSPAPAILLYILGGLCLLFGAAMFAGSLSAPLLAWLVIPGAMLLRWLVIPGALLVGGATLLLLRRRKKQREERQALANRRQEAEEALMTAITQAADRHSAVEAAARELADSKAALGAEDGDTAEEIAARAEALLEACKDAAASAKQTRELADKLLPPPLTLDEDENISGETGMSRDEAEDSLRDTQDSLKKTLHTLAFEQGASAHLGDPLVIATEQVALQEKIDRLEKENSALELAAEALRASHAQLQSQFSPLVSQKAAALLSRMTDNHYAGVYFDRDLHFSVRRPEDVSPRESDYLSQGARSQLYLAVRLALSELVLPGAEPCPLVLDDALVSFDDARAKSTLRLLRELSRERQILLFTCQSREARLLRELEAEDA